ncbi:hypothetical protein KY289_007805 [Solanum tuberosum]|nr:hypothetical protein KY289_007805 [Solanum tuberosum]
METTITVEQIFLMPSTIKELATATVDAAIETIEMIESKRNHPLYMHPSDTSASILTSLQLIGAENYSLWSRSMLITLRAKSKIGFVLGICRKGDYSSALEEQWKKCNAFVLAWIMNLVSKELLSGIVYASDDATVWAYLKERFDKVDGSRIYQLHREICTIYQDKSQRITSGIRTGDTLENMSLYVGKWNYVARGNYTGGDKNESVNGGRGNNNAKKKVN